MIKALIDTNVWDCRTTHEWVHVEKKFRWGDGSFTTVLVEPQVRLIRPTLDESLRIYDALRSVGDLGRNGTLALYRSMEIAFEGMYRPIRGGMLDEHDVFCGVRATVVHGPVLRDFVFTGRKNDANTEKLAFMEHISAPRFRDLRKNVAKRHLLDLYHLWTAEHHGLDCFITLDTKFVNAVTFPKPLKTSVRVCTPFQFVELFQKGEFDALLET